MGCRISDMNLEIILFYLLLYMQWYRVLPSFRVMARCITRRAHQIHTSTMRRVRFLANSATLLATAVADYGSAQKTNK